MNEGHVVVAPSPVQGQYGISTPERIQEGSIITFYSYKGGGGRTLALANIAALLAQWGYRVLCVDWDLEAPGLHLYYKPWMEQMSHPGLTELIQAHAEGKEPVWGNYVTPVSLPGETASLSLMTAGVQDEGYISRVQALDWNKLYEIQQLGNFLEDLRNQWKVAFDFICIDSRTGITDIGGICTIQMPDVLALLFTANAQSLYGVIDIAQRAERLRNYLPFDRAKLLVLPVVARFEGRVEYEIAQDWLQTFAKELAPWYAEWMHRDVSVDLMLDFTRVPYVPYWSFGEKLPVLEESTRDPDGISFALESLAALIAQKLAFSDVLAHNRDAFVAAAKRGALLPRWENQDEAWLQTGQGIQQAISESTETVAKAPVFSGRQKLAFARRLADNWQDLADYFDIPIDDRQSFAPGREPHGVWEWLEARQRLPELLDALRYIDRADIVVEVLAPPATSASTPGMTWQGSPFPGLRHFTPDDAAIFFGRNQESTELLARVQRERFVAVVGASGSGKSSLVAAGVLPRLHEMPGGQHWQWVRVTPGDPGDDPFVALAIKLAPTLERHGLSGRTIADRLRASGDLAAVAELFLAGWPAGAELLLFIDQFEELFTLTAPAHHRRFIAMLARAAQSPRLRTVLTLRADFYHRCVDSPDLATLLRAGSFPLAAPDLPALLEMITGPAAVAGLTFQDGLASRILRDTGSDPGALALLAFALAELYAACQPGTTLTRAAYDSFGGVQGAIARRAETTYSALTEAAQGAFGEVFKELVEVDPERGIPIRKRAPLARFAGARTAQQLIDRFVEARLLVCGDPAMSDVVVEVAHEALLTSWLPLHAWILERFDDLRLLRQVQREAEEWERRGYPAAHLWRHERLQPVYDMRQRRQPALSATVQTFIRPEAERLLEEIDHAATSHQRRASIGDRLADIGDPRPGVGLNSDGVPEFVWLLVPGGEITLENDAGTFTVQPFAISKYPVTWAQYRSFLEADDGYRQRRWWRGLAEREAQPGEQYRQQDNHPAEYVSWYDAVAFCRWLSTRLEYEVRLPTEWEWQQAATGGDPAREYPWGADWDPTHANAWESGLSRTTAVGVYPRGASSVGVLDMSGNVWEWCLNEHDRPQRTGLSGDARRVVRGGSWAVVQVYARASYRFGYVPVSRYDSLGLRVVRSSPSLP